MASVTLAAVLATHGAGLLPLLRELLSPSASAAAPDDRGVARSPDEPGRYQHIDVTVHDG